MNKTNVKQNSIQDNYSFLILLFLIGIGLLIRLYYIPFQVPISLDSIDYFAYSVAITKEGYFPTGYLLTNFGWSTFLSVIFSTTTGNEMLELMNAQRIFSIIISVSTAIPIYFICRTFFQKNIAVLGSALFLFEPRIIENSVLGISDPIFIFFVAITIMFTFIKDTRYFYLSFVFAALAAFVRYEGFLLIFPLIISFIIRKDFQKKSILSFCIGTILFFSIVFLIDSTAYENSNLNVMSPLFGGTNYVSNYVLSEKHDPDDLFFGETAENKTQTFLYNLSSGYLKYLGWIMIPILGLFIIPGLFLTRKISKNKIIFLAFIVSISIASLYAYGRGIQETRYLYPLIPIFILFACQFFDFLSNRLDAKKIMIVSLFLIIVFSILFIEYDKIDSQYEKEVYDATIFVVPIASGLNEYDGNKFVRTAALENSWPELLPKNEKNKMTANVKKFSSTGFTSLQNFLKSNESKGLTHLFITENEDQFFLKNILDNEHDYVFLNKIYDSKELGFKNNIKIFEIDYNILN